MVKYFINPQTGDINNDGSELKPWNTLTDVFLYKKILKPDDELVLLTGFHGNPTINNIENIKIYSLKNNVGCLGTINIFNSENIAIKNVYISNAYIKNIIKKNIVEIKNSKNIIIEESYIFNTLNIKWTNEDWDKFKSAIIINSSQNIILKKNHIFNNITTQINISSNEITIENNIMENFSTDGFGNRSNNIKIIGNIIRNLNKVNINHNDIMQFWGCKNSIIKNNLLIISQKNNQNNKGLDFQAMGFFDGIFENQIIENNEIYVDHPIGIWILGAFNCKINNNYVHRCSYNTFFNKSLPSITINNSKTNLISENNIITNNNAERFNIIQKGGIENNNKTITPDILPSINVGCIKTMKILDKKDIKKNMSYLDIYKDILLSPITKINISTTNIGCLVSWINNSQDNIEGFYIYKNNIFYTKLMNITTNIIFPFDFDFTQSNIKIIPYINQKFI
jgi:hypothetical protein